jgi:hypothetical protein
MDDFVRKYNLSKLTHKIENLHKDTVKENIKDVYHC